MSAIFVAILAVAAPAVAQDPRALQFSGEDGQVLSWDEDGNPGNWSQNDKPQFKNTCGDDPNEHLIKEHVGDSTEFDPDENDKHRYVCADRPTDCAFNGSVYSQGQAADLGSENEEDGDVISEPEICLDDDPSLAGGEWYDLDDDRMRTTKLTENQADNLTRTHRQGGDVVNPVLETLWEQNPGTDTTGPFTGYATEDDCDPDLGGSCDDGNSSSSLDWFNGGKFTEGAKQDNNMFSSSTGGVHNKIQDDSDQLEPGGGTEDYLDDRYSWFGDNTVNDSVPGPDNWTLSDTLSDSVSNTGRSVSAGRCYVRRGLETRTNITNATDTKMDRLFGNSYADSSDIDGDGEDEGVWEDPDNLSASELSFSCDLTRDRGLALNKSTVTGNNYRDGDRIYVGDLKFEQDGPTLAEGLEGPLCGDDESEYFIETVGSPEKGEEKDGAYMCATSPDRCVLPTSGPGGPELYRTGDYKNVEEPSESEGRFKQDNEVCLNPGSSSSEDTLENPLHGVWYDQDYMKSACNVNTLYGDPGIRWLSSSYVTEYPYAVTGGIDDDFNDFLNNTGASPKEANEAIPLDSDESPVETGTDRGHVLSTGFCGGDDGSEYLASQICPADICETDRTHVGVAKEPGSCVYDGGKDYEDVKPPVDDDKHNRSLYGPGDTITLDYAQRQNITCVGGKWYEEGPIKFESNKVKVPLGGSSTAPFSVINLGILERTYEVTLEEDTQAGVFSSVDQRPQSFDVDVAPKQSKDLALNVRGVRDDLSDSEREVTVRAEALNVKDTGTDTLKVNITNPGNSTVQYDNERNVPGITALQVTVLLAVSSAIYLRLL